MSHSLVFFEEENYLSTKYKLVKEVCINQVFFLILLTVFQKDINCNYNTNLSYSQVCLANFKVDRIDCYKNQ